MLSQAKNQNIHQTYSTATVKAMSLKRRNCISHEEDWSAIDPRYRPKYFKYYSMEGCILECRAAYSMRMCSCLPYYYPNFVNNSACNVVGLECLANISGKIGLPYKL